MPRQKKSQTLADALIVGAIAIPGAFVPLPWHVGVSGALAPKSRRTEVAARSASASYSGWAGAIGTAAALKGKKGMGRYFSQQSKGIGLLKGKRIKSGLKMIARAQKPFFTAGVVGTSIGAAYGHYTGVQKTAMFEKLGFNPAAFAKRTSPHENLAFVERFQQTPASAKSTGAAMNPLVLGLGAITYLFGRDVKSKDEAKTDTVRKPKGFLPKFTIFLTALIATKKWKEATKKDKQRFVREYNASMGTRYKVDHPKMQALWGLMRKGPSRTTSLSKYASSKIRKAMKVVSRAGRGSSTDFTEYEMRVRKTKEFVGSLAIRRSRISTTAPRVISSELTEKFQGMGLGKKLYGEAVMREGALAPDATVSPQAARVWNSMRKRYPNTKKGVIAA